MAKKILIICLLLSFLLVSIPVFGADKLEVTLSQDEMTGYTDDIASIDINIQNNQNFQDDFSIEVWPSITLNGVTPTLESYRVRVGANSESKVKLHFTIAIDAEEQTNEYSITVRSLTEGNVSESKKFHLRVLRKFPVYISNLDLSQEAINPGESLAIETIVRNLVNLPSERYVLLTRIKISGRIVKEFENVVSNIAPKATKSVLNVYTSDKYAEPGTYTVEVMLKDKDDKIISSRSLDFKILSLLSLSKQKFVTNNLFFQSTTIIIKNEGNIPNTFDIKESFPQIVQSMFRPHVQPMKIEKSGDIVYYSWRVSGLRPGEEVIMKYDILPWNIWLTGFLFSVFILILFKYVYVPKIVKKPMYRGPITYEKEIMITLEVKNHTDHELKDVIVRDFVPSLAIVVEKFQTLKPTIRTGENGTELTWSIESLAPGEERVLTYKIKPIVEIIGTLRLPYATIRYVDHKKEVKKALSKTVTIKPE